MKPFGGKDCALVAREKPTATTVAEVSFTKARYPHRIPTLGLSCFARLLLDQTIKPSSIVKYLDHYVIGQDEAKKTVAVAVYSHFRKIAHLRRTDTPIVKSNVLLIGSSGTGKTLLCNTLSTFLGVPFVTAEATSLAQTRYVNEEIEAILQRLVDKAEGDIARAQNGIVFIDEIDKLKAAGGETRSTSGESVQHALLKIMDRLNSRVKPTDLFTFGLIPEFTGRLPVVANFQDLSRKMLVRIMTEPKNSIYSQFREIFRNENVELTVSPLVFEQIAEIAFEYKTGARSLRGIFEELITPVLYIVPDKPEISKVAIVSMFSEPTYS